MICEKTISNIGKLSQKKSLPIFTACVKSGVGCSIDLSTHLRSHLLTRSLFCFRHSQEREDLKKQHELQWEKLHQRISEPATEDLQQNKFQLQSEQRSANGEEKDHLSLLPSSVDSTPGPPGVFDGIQTTGYSMDISPVFVQSDLNRFDAVDRENTWGGIVRCVDGVRNLGGVYGVPQQLPAQVRSQLATPSMTMLQRQVENQASSQQLEQHIWSDLVDRALNQSKLSPVLHQMESLNWYQQLEMFQHLQAAGPLEHRMRQQILQRVSLLEAIKQAQNQSVNFRCQRFPNHQCHCAIPCNLSQSFLPYNQEHSSSVEPYSIVNLNGRSGLSYKPNFSQVLPSAIQQSPCNEVSSYHCPENLAFSSNRQAMCCSPNQLTCLLDAARNDLIPASPVIMRLPPPPPMPQSHLVARQSPLSLDGTYPPSLRPSPLLGLPFLSPLPDFQFPPTYTMVPDIRQFLFSPNPFAN